MSNATTRPAQTEAEMAKQAAGQAAGHAGQAAQDFTRVAGQKVQDAAQTAGQKVQEAAHIAGQKVQNVARTAEHKAEDATAALGGSLKTAAAQVREHTPNEGMLGMASEAVAGSLERGGAYLQEKNLSGMGEDLTQMIKRNPIPAVLVGVGLGFLLGRTLRS